MQDEATEVQEENELLKQQIAALAGSEKEVGVFLSMGHGITERMATMLVILVKRSPAVVSKSAFHSLIYGGLEDGGPDPKIFTVYLNRLREWLDRMGSGGRIQTVWNTGYRADKDLVKWAKHHYSQHIEEE